MVRSVHRSFGKLLSFFVVVVFLFSQSLATPPAHAAAVTPDTKVKHKAIKYLVPGKRIVLNARVKDDAGVKIVRCYFRSHGEADFVFVPMSDPGSGVYTATLPAPGTLTPSIDYVFLVVNGQNQVVKTQTYTVTVSQKETDKTPAWQQAVSNGDIVVNTEISPAPAQLAGFSDSITIDVVESSARFGLVAGGLYAAGSSTAAGATAATAAGSITASAGVSTAVIAGVGAAVIAGGVAVGAGGGGGGGGSCSQNSLSTSDFTGDWEITVDSDGVPATGYYITCTLSSGGTFTYVEYVNYSASDSGSGTWSVSNNTFTAIYNSQSQCSGQVSDDTPINSFSVSGSWYSDDAVYNWTRD